MFVGRRKNLCLFKDMIGANGRPVILHGVRYRVDVAALEAHAASAEANAPASSDASQVRSKLSERELIQRFLHNVQHENGLGHCNVSYTHSEIGQALIDAGFIKHARLYPDRWPTCATQLGKKLRSLALGRFYVELDDKDAFHRLLQAKTSNAAAKERIETLITDASLKPDIAAHYFGQANEAAIAKVKKLLHALSNEGSVRTWRDEHNVPIEIDEHSFVVDFAERMREVAEEFARTEEGLAATQMLAKCYPTKQIAIRDKTSGKRKTITTARDAKRTWKSYLLQQDECRGLLKKKKASSRGPFRCGDRTPVTRLSLHGEV